MTSHRHHVIPAALLLSALVYIAPAQAEEWTDITNQLSVQDGAAYYNRQTRTSFARVTITTPGKPISGPVRLVVTESSSPPVAADGTTDADDPNPGDPYYIITLEGLAADKTLQYVLQFGRSRGNVSYEVAVENGPPPAMTAYPAPALSSDGSVTINRWFALINGAGPVEDAGPENPPLVLTVNGQPPDGAPGPNGGDGVGVRALPTTVDATGASVAALWRALPVSTPGAPADSFYLRSAKSFRVAEQSSGANGQAITYPSLLVGYGIDTAPLDLGYVDSFAPHAGIFWNQSSSPSGDNSAFQSWTYDTATGALLWQDSDALCYDSASTAEDSRTWIGCAPGTPEGRWIAWPDYSLSRLMAMEPRSPPFPEYAAGTGEGAAYNHISALALVTPPEALPACTIANVPYSGIRCRYQVQNDYASISRCADIALLPTHPDVYQGVAITDQDWDKVRRDMYAECSYVVQAMDTFNAYNAIFETVFLSETDRIAPLVSDIEMSTSTQLDTTPIDIVEGMLYTLLGATGDPAAGAFANIMSSAVGEIDDAATMTDSLGATAANLYAELGKRMLSVQTAMGDLFNTIVWDFDKLAAFFYLSIKPGYNNIGITADVQDSIEADANAAFSVAAMQQLMPAYYSLWQNAALTGDAISDWLDHVPAVARYQFGAFGVGSDGTDNLNYLVARDDSGFPDEQVITTDVLRNGGNAFELFNALNGWSAMPLIPDIDFNRNNLGCSGVVFTLFNASPYDLSVTVTPQQGKIAAPGYSYNANLVNLSEVEGSESSTKLELRPYGYTPIFVTAFGGIDNNNLTISLLVTEGSTGLDAADITFGGDGCRGQVTTDILSQATYNGWSLSRGPSRQQDGNYPAGLSATLWMTD